MVYDCPISLSFSFDCLLSCGSLFLCGVRGWSAVCDCGISWPFSLLFAVVWEFCFLVVSWVGLWSVIVTFPGHTCFLVKCIRCSNGLLSHYYS